MGIAIEPVPYEPCVDSDCYYAGGETLTWWTPTPPPSTTPEPGPWWEERPGITPPPTLVDVPQPTPSTPTPPPHLTPTPSPTPETPAPSPTPETSTPGPGVGSPSDPLYTLIGALIGGRPSVPSQQTQPIIVPPPDRPPPWVPILIVALGVGGLVAYGALQRRR